MLLGGMVRSGSELLAKSAVYYLMLKHSAQQTNRRSRLRKSQSVFQGLVHNRHHHLGMMIQGTRYLIVSGHRAKRKQKLGRPRQIAQRQYLLHDRMRAVSTEHSLLEEGVTPLKISELMIKT